MRTRSPWVVVIAVVVAAALTAPPSHATVGRSFASAVRAPVTTETWRWPVDAFRLVRAYEAPAHEYGPGHRGIDLAPESPVVRAPATGIVAFAGQVVDRGVVTLDHGGGLVTTLEPVHATVTVGQTIARGAEVGTLSEGGHTEHGALHFGVRLQGEYINPLVLLGGVPRAVLLPCC